MACLEIDSCDEAPLLDELKKVLTWFEKLETLDTSGVEPLVTMACPPPVLHEGDTPQTPLGHERVVANMPEKGTHYFSVPQVKD